MTDQLGTLLRRLRRQAGLTQEQVAERSGVSVRTIRRLESGRSTDHRLGTVNLLADALDLGQEDRRQLAVTLAAARSGSAPAVPGPSPAPTGAPTGAPPDGPADGPAPLPARATPPEPAAPPGPPAPGPPAVPAVPAPRPVHGALVDAAQELATEVRRRWRREEAQRRVHDPFPLPVRWQRAPAGLTDRSENIQRLGPGAVARRMDLSGDLRSVAEVYRRISSGRLVILGRAGSGKSILTIRFVLDHLEAPTVSDRVPVIFGLGSWDPTTTALRDWLIGRLLRDHPHLARRGPHGSTLAAALVDADLVLPVLDGFDEIAEGLRREALDALNATSLPLVLTSRHDEFAEAVQEAHAPLLWAAGIELSDLTLDDLVHYLPRTARAVTRDGGAGHGGAGGDGAGGGDSGSVWDAVLDELRAGESPAGARLAAVLTTPLMVILARTAYSETPGRTPTDLLDPARFPTAKSLEEHLLAGFVPAVYRRRAPERDTAGRPATSPDWDPGRAQHWLGHLAHHLVRLDHDRQDLAWWQIGDSLPRSTRVLAVVVATALSVTLSDWLVVLFVGLLGARFGLGPGIGIGEVLLQGSLMGPVAGLAFGSVYAILITFGGGEAFEPTRVRLRLPGTHRGLGRRPVRTFLARFGDGLLGGSVMGVGCACALALERALYTGAPLANPDVLEGTLINMLCFGLIFGSAAGLVFGLSAALEAPVDVTSAATPVSLLAANRATVGRKFLVLAPALTLGIAGGGRLVVGLLQGVLGPLSWGFPDGLVIGAIGGIGGTVSYLLAFTAWGQWLVLSRVWLPLTGRLPWQTVAFLEDAYHRGVLRQTGAVYQFRHERLQHHLGRTFRQQHSHYAPATFPSASTATNGPTATNGSTGSTASTGSP
ncbi:helix-turn-helix domain-containing protein [Kitasatospora sp. NPDC091207]|uniref:helix-turn-helix domain-containing protein n=1 Tax=Kitasatospora sp. NPDC091207 TaxID=3364083 RepID=UPI003825FBEF